MQHRERKKKKTLRETQQRYIILIQTTQIWTHKDKQTNVKIIDKSLDERFLQACDKFEEIKVIVNISLLPL